jgi:hypothetical protein
MEDASLCRPVGYVPEGLNKRNPLVLAIQAIGILPDIEYHILLTAMPF